MTQEVEFETTVMIPVTVAAVVKLSRPAPSCSDHDSPAFSDSGDPAVVQVMDVYFAGIEISDDLSDGELELLEEQAITQAEDENG